MATHDANHHGGPTGDAGVEPDYTPSRGIGLFLAATVLFLVATFYGVTAFFDMQAAVITNSAAVNKAALEQIEARDKAKLSEYSQVSKEHGAYRIPIDRAKELVATQPQLLGPLPRLMPDEGSN
jgi:hypothetical protein